MEYTPTSCFTNPGTLIANSIDDNEISNAMFYIEDYMTDDRSKKS